MGPLQTGCSLYQIAKRRRRGQGQSERKSEKKRDMSVVLWIKYSKRRPEMEGVHWLKSNK